MKTKITSILTKAAMMLLTVLLTMTAQTAWAATMQFPIYSGDEGTSGKPYQIKTIDDLNKLAADVNSGTNYLDKYFKLMTDSRRIHLSLSFERYALICQHLHHASIQRDRYHW